MSDICIAARRLSLRARYRDLIESLYRALRTFLGGLAWTLVAGAGAHAALADPLFAPADESVAFEGAAYRMSVYEVQKRFVRFLDAEPQRLQLEDRALFQEWDRWFREYAALLDEAYDRGYDSRPDILEILDAMARFLVAQKDANYLRVVGEPFVLGEAALEEKYSEYAMSGGAAPFELFQESHRKLEEQKHLIETVERIEARLESDLRLQIDFAAAEFLASIVREHPILGREIRPAWIGASQGIVVARYAIEGREIALDFREFARRYNLLPMRNAIEDPQAIAGYARGWAFEDWLWLQARERGLLDSPKFRQDGLAYLRDTMVRELIRDEAARLHPPTPEAIAARFDEQKHRMRRVDEVRARAYRFADRMEAFEAYKAAASGRAQIDAPFETVVVNANADEWPQSLRDQIALASEGSILPPAPLPEGQAAVLRIEAVTRSRPFALADAESDLRAQLIEARSDGARLHLLEELQRAHSGLEEAPKPGLAELLAQRRAEARKRSAHIRPTPFQRPVASRES